jgi:Thioredoxin-like
VHATLHACGESRSHAQWIPTQLRVVLILVTSLVACICCFSDLAAAEPNTAPPYHPTILGASPTFVDRTGSRLPSKYASYLSQQKYLLLYFASNADAKSQKFTSELTTWYLANGGGNQVEVILIGKELPADEPTTWMKTKDMPWLALAQDDANHANITTKYGNTLLPTLVLLDENDEVVARSNEGEKNLGTRAVFKKYAEITKISSKK